MLSLKLFAVTYLVGVCHLFENNTTMAALILLLADLIPASYSIGQYLNQQFGLNELIKGMLQAINIDMVLLN